MFCGRWRCDSVDAGFRVDFAVELRVLCVTCGSDSAPVNSANTNQVTSADTNDEMKKSKSNSKDIKLSAELVRDKQVSKSAGDWFCVDSTACKLVLGGHYSFLAFEGWFFSGPPDMLAF